jgi:hypothetical protein
LARIPGVVASAQVESRTLPQALEQLLDPRGRRGQRYPLPALLGLVLLALLCGEDSLRGISRFALEHPSVLRGLGFRGNTVPGRSTLSELLDQLDPFRLREAFKTVSGLPTLGLQGVTLECLRRWSLEVRRGLDPNRLSGLLEQLGWPGLQDWMVLSEHGDGTLTIRSVPQIDSKVTPPRASVRIGTGAPETLGFNKVDLQFQPDRVGSGTNLEL